MGSQPSDSPFLNVILEIVDAADQREAFETEVQFHWKLSHPTCHPLDIQSMPAKYPYLDEKRHVLVVHLFKVEGAKLAIPSVVMTDQGLPIELQTIDRYYKVVSQGLSGITEIDRALLAEAQVVLQEWAQQLREQGWIGIAQGKRTG